MSTYLFINLAAVSIPFLFSFHNRLRFHKEWYRFFPAVLLAGSLFIAWDIAFTRMGIWGFNPRYLTGVYLFDLPLEEILFFLCIPYACIFTYHCLDQLVKVRPLRNLFPHFGYVFFTLTGIAGMLFLEKWYTLTAFIALGVLGLFTSNKSWMPTFFFTYLFLLAPFLLVNGILTGTGIDQPIVWYNNTENLDLRIGTIPIEDFFYSMLMLLSYTLLYESLKKKSDKEKSHSMK